MAKKEYDWRNPPPLDGHTKCKHDILRGYLESYLGIRCQNPQQGRFRIAIVDGFCGGGRYKGGAPGSPIIILEVLKAASEGINAWRSSQELKPLQMDVLLIMNDLPDTVEICKEQTAPLLAEISENPHLSISPHYLGGKFEESYQHTKSLIVSEGYHSNTFYNLDQYGHANVSIDTLRDIMGSHRSPEILLTFAIDALVTYLPKKNQEKLLSQLNHLGVSVKTIAEFKDSAITTNREWLGAVEVEIFNALFGLAQFTSPFAINNPEGWYYWLIHFANNYRARQAYNNVLHENSSSQAHFGRSGLQMLSFSPEDGMLYAFRSDDRNRAIDQLHNDIPKTVANFGDAISVEDFYRAIYNETPAHYDDITKVMLENSDLQVITPAGAERRKQVIVGDVLKLNPQRGFFSILALESMRKTKSNPEKE